MNNKKKIKIAIVEDNEYYNRVLTKYIQTLCDGFKYIYPTYEFALTSYLSASECIDELEKDLDILLLDYYFSSEEDQFEELTGGDVLDEVKKYCKNCKIIMVTEQKQVPTAVELMKKGVYDYVDKNSNTEDRIGSIIHHIMHEINRETVEV